MPTNNKALSAQTSAIEEITYLRSTLEPPSGQFQNFANEFSVERPMETSPKSDKYSLLPSQLLRSGAR